MIQSLKNFFRLGRSSSSILDALEEGVIIIDSHLTVCYANAHAVKLLGVSDRQGISSRSAWRHCRALLEICLQKQEIVTDSFLFEEEGVYLELIAKPRKTGAFLLLRDRSRHHRIVEMGKDFVANASHELKTPITIIRGFAETLQEMPELPREITCDILEKIVRNCQRMENLVKSLLTLADIENLPETRFCECDLGALLEGCYTTVLALHPSSLVQLHLPPYKIFVRADPDILELAILNLCDNAVKYSPPPADLQLLLEMRDHSASISIQDKGVGIPPQNIEQIFQRFYTVDKAHSRRMGGAGLGLSIVKTIVEKHHGSISVSSTLGKGSTFRILLPLTKVS